MTELRLVQVDAFADRPFTGNPAAVMPLEEWLPDETLQAIAMENNLSETAFTIPTQDGEADYELRWFTPTTEVVLCGHATFASGHVLMEERERIRFRTRRAGMLEVRRDGDGYAMSLPAWKPEPKLLPNIVEALGVTPVETLWHEQRYGLIIVEREEEVLNLKPDFGALAADGDVLTIVSAPGTRTDIVSRVFAPGAGIDEDPVTGSAHAVMVPYWAERLGRDRFTAWQASRRGGYLDCRLEEDRVILGGKCVTTVEGRLRF
ncbi:MAG TPA: PhzF family phenazine biosynthesis protein [Allosphingosinicella sp.]|uniref:PhzF family phenazine biosynthesis protein n=1 Tax=Allosphingosinicella sp. TaxID=2823234 RepID=UPI002ED87D63